MQYFTITIKIPKPSHHRTAVALVLAVLAVLAVGTWWTMLPGDFALGALLTPDLSPELGATVASLAKSPFVLRQVFDHPEIAKLPILAEVSNPREWARKHMDVDYVKGLNMVTVRIYCHPKEREQTRHLVTQIVQTTAECTSGNQVKATNVVYGRVGAFKKLPLLR